MMAQYIYVSEAGDLKIERHYEAGRAPSKITVGGMVYWRVIDAFRREAEERWTSYGSNAKTASKP